MPLEELKKDIQTLKDELNHISTIDADLLQRLHTLDDTIHQVLQSHHVEPVANQNKEVTQPSSVSPAFSHSSDESDSLQSASAASSLKEELLHLAAEFANEHPQIETTLRKISYILGRMGI